MPATLFQGTRFVGEVAIGDFTLDVHRCGSCGVIFAMDDDFTTQRKRDKASWYCPNGHSFSYTGKSDIEKLKDQVAEERRRSQASRDLLQAEERSHAATRGHLTRTKKRVAAGVCPCCNRTFQQLSRHMENKHPDFIASTLDNGPT